MRQSRVHPFFCAVLLIFTTVPYGVNARDCHTSWRRAWRDLTCEQQDGYLDAVLQLKVSGIYDDEFRYTHKYFGKLTHATAEFLPWHRWFLYQFEKALQQVTGKYIYVPYWDWERDAGNEQLSTVFHAETFGTYGNVEEGTNCTVDGQFNSTPGSVFEHASYFRDYVKKDCLQRVFNDDVQFSGESQILAMIASLEQYEDATDPDDDRAANGFRTILEGTPHAFPHIMLGRHMTTDFSPDDPLFYVHHANVDCMWSLWQDYWDHDLVDYDDFEVPWHYEGDLLDEPLPFGLKEISWDFQMEWEEQNDSGEWIVKKGYPSPRDLLSNRQPHISVRYVNDYLSTIMPGHEPNPRWFQASEGEVEVQCDRDKVHWAGRSLGIDDRTESPSTQCRNVRGYAIYEVQVLPFTCSQRNPFTRKEDQQRWNYLCQTMPRSTSEEDRLAAIAELDCDERWKLKDWMTSQTRGAAVTQNWIHSIGKKHQLAAFDCFHRPDICFASVHSQYREKFILLEVVNAFQQTGLPMSPAQELLPFLQICFN